MIIKFLSYIKARPYFLFCIGLLYNPINLYAEKGSDTPLTEIRVRIGNATDAQEARQMEQLLSHLKGQPANEDLTKKAELILRKTQRYRSSVCRLGKKGRAGRITCGLTRSRTIRFIKVEGLPPSFLETDFRKRIFLKEGELIDQQEVSGKNRITRQRKRLEKYLFAEGYSSAKVQVLTPPVPGSHAVDILVRIKGGHFVQVRKAYNKGDDSPIPLTIVFKRMCASIDHFIETIGPQEVSCFTPQLFKEVLKATETKIRSLGYKSAKLRADIIPVTKPMMRAGDDKCHAKKGDKPGETRCVDIKMKLRLGKQETMTLRIQEKNALKANWLKSFLSYVPLHRAHNAIQQAFEPATVHGALLNENDFNNIIEDKIGTQVKSLTNEELFEISKNESQKSLYTLSTVRVRTRTKKSVSKQKVKILPGSPFRIKNIKFIGNNHFDDQELLNEVLVGTKPYTLFSDGALVDSYLNADMRRIQEHYASVGYLQATVSNRISADAHHNVEIIFVINEGIIQKITGAYLHHGVKSLQSFVINHFDLCPKLPLPENLEKQPLGPFCIGAAYFPDKAETQRQKLTSLYAQKGYPYAHVSLETKEQESGIELHYHIDPDMTFKTQESLRAFKQNLPPVLLGEILFDGNVQTQTSVLRREMGLPENYRNIPLDPLYLSDGIGKLRKTGLFSRVQLKYLGIEEEWRRVYPQIFVEEKSYLTLDTSFSFATDTFFSSQTKLKHRNLFGAMLDYEGVLDNGLFWGRVSLLRSSLKWPHILGTPLNFHIIAPEIYYEDRPQPVSIDSQTLPPRQRTAQTRVTAGLDWALPNTDTISIDYEMRWEWWDPSGPPISLLQDANRALTTIDGFLVATELTPIQKGLIRPSYRSLKLDNPFNPKEGHQMELGVGFSHPLLGGATTYTILMANLSKVTTFGPITTALRLSSKLSAVDNPDEQWFVLRNEIPTLGGDRSVRGYGDRSIGVLGPLKDQKGDDLINEDTGEIQLGIHTGNISHLMNIELRFPLLPTITGDDFQGALFSDLGIVTITQNPLDLSATFKTVTSTEDPNQLGLSVGAGLRYILPVGPIAADVAFSPIHQQLNGSPLWRFHLQFGFPF